MIIGTAGHIDHGKTELIKALTGIDTDRLKEEKSRGISIELGYAYMDVEHGNITRRVGFIDVPGHSKFIRTMIQGANFIDFLLLVVDAKRGIQQQTIEHFSIAKILGIRKGTAVITKSDKVDDETLNLRRNALQDLIKQTFIDSIFIVDSISGKGIHSLKEHLSHKLLEDLPDRSFQSFPLRYDIDRVFSLRGHGLIVTGCCSSGTLNRDEEVIVLNNNKKAVIRNIQIHNKNHPIAGPGQRIALNLKGVSREHIKKGYTLSKNNHIRSSKYIFCNFQKTGFEKNLKNHKRVRIIHKSNEFFARPKVSYICPSILGLRLEEPAFVCFGDKFIIRDISNKDTLGGGEVLYFSEHSRSLNHKNFVNYLINIKQNKAPDNLIKSLMEQYPYYCPASKVMQDFSIDKKELDQILIDSEHFFETCNGIIANKRLMTLLRENTLSIFKRHKTYSIPVSCLKKELAINSPCIGFTEIGLRYLLECKVLSKEGNSVRLAKGPAFNTFTDKDTIIEEIISLLDNTLLRDISEIIKNFEKPQKDILIIIKNNPDFIIIKDKFIILDSKLSKIEDILISYLKSHFFISVSDFKKLFGITRKYAVPLLEYFDQRNITYRKESLRYLNQRKLK